MSGPYYDRPWGMSYQKDRGYTLHFYKVRSWEYGIRSILMGIVGDRCCRWFWGYPSTIIHKLEWCITSYDDKHEITSMPITPEQAKTLDPSFVGWHYDEDDDDDFVPFTD